MWGTTGTAIEVWVAVVAVAALGAADVHIAIGTLSGSWAAVVTSKIMWPCYPAKCTFCVSVS